MCRGRSSIFVGASEVVWILFGSTHNDTRFGLTHTADCLAIIIASVNNVNCSFPVLYIAPDFESTVIENVVRHKSEMLIF